MSWSPDSSKLAIAQSDQIVFIYKLGIEWGEKKSICNKFHQASPVTCLTWPSQHPNEVVFGLAEGKVKIGQLKTNKPATLYNTESYTVSLCSSPDGNAVLSGHLDGCVYRFFFEDGGAGGGPSYTKFLTHPTVPYCLGWGASVVCAGNDGRVVFYDPADAATLRTFDYRDDPKVKEFGAIEFAPSGQSCVLGNFNKFFVYGYNNRTSSWEESSVKNIENLFTVTAIGWKADGSRLAIGALCGVVDLYDACPSLSLPWQV
jgi:intraflagellar transport protein 172